MAEYILQNHHFSFRGIASARHCNVTCMKMRNMQFVSISKTRYYIFREIYSAVLCDVTEYILQHQHFSFREIAFAKHSNASLEGSPRGNRIGTIGREPYS